MLLLLKLLLQTPDLAFELTDSGLSLTVCCDRYLALYPATRNWPKPGS